MLSEKRSKSVIKVAISAMLLFGTPQSFAGADPGQTLLDSIFKRAPGAQLPIPQEVLESMHIAIALGHVKAINLFPYGQGQIAHVKKSGIQSVTVNFREITGPESIALTVSQTLVIKFSRDGFVERIEQFWGPTKRQTDTYAYENGIVAKMRAVDELGGALAPPGTSGTEILLSAGEDFYYSAYQFRPSGKIPYREVRLNRRMRLVSQSLRDRSRLDFRYDQTGSLRRIVEQLPLGGSFRPISTVEFSVDYDGIFPKSSIRESVVSTDNPFYYKHNPNPFVFQISDLVLQYRVDRNFETGAIITKNGISYGIRDNNLQEVRQSWQQSEDIWTVAYNGDEVSHVVRSSGPDGGFRIVGANGRVDEIVYGGPLFGFKANIKAFLMSGAVKFRYEPSSERPYRFELTPVGGDKRYSGTINSELTTYYER